MDFQDLQEVVPWYESLGTAGEIKAAKPRLFKSHRTDSYCCLRLHMSSLFSCFLIYGSIVFGVVCPFLVLMEAPDGGEVSWVHMFEGTCFGLGVKGNHRNRRGLPI